MNLFEIIRSNILLFIGLFIAYYLIVFISKLVLCIRCQCDFCKTKHIVLKIILALLLPDYLITKLMKEKYKNEQSETNEDADVEKQKLGKMIKKFNCFNLVLSIILCVVFITVALISSNKWNNLLIMIMIIRYLSRTLEVVISFVLDIFDKQNEKSSNLAPKERIKLALKSFLEIFILAFTFIFLINNDIFNSFVITFESIFQEFDKCDNIKFIQLFLALTFYAIITNYISNIINNKADK